jgi:hypothetical protein
MTNITTNKIQNDKLVRNMVNKSELFTEGRTFEARGLVNK